MPLKQNVVVSGGSLHLRITFFDANKRSVYSFNGYHENEFKKYDAYPPINHYEYDSLPVSP